MIEVLHFGMRAGNLAVMASDRVTITLDKLTREFAEQQAKIVGVSLSAYISRAVRRQTLADSVRAEAEWLAAHPAELEQARQDELDDERERELSRQVDDEAIRRGRRAA